MKTRFLVVLGIIILLLGIDGFWFVSSEIHENCIFNLRIGHETYANSYVPCEITSYVIPISIVLFLMGLGILIFCTVKKSRHMWTKGKVENEN